MIQLIGFRNLGLVDDKQDDKRVDRPGMRGGRHRIYYCTMLLLPRSWQADHWGTGEERCPSAARKFRLLLTHVSRRPLLLSTEAASRVREILHGDDNCFISKPTLLIGPSGSRPHRPHPHPSQMTKGDRLAHNTPRICEFASTATYLG